MNIEVANKTICITGKFTHVNRGEATAHLASMGAKMTGSVSAKTDILFVGDKAGSKLAKAKSLGIVVYDETQLMTVLSATPAPVLEAAPVAQAHGAETPFTGKAIALTGTFATMKRSDAKTVLIQAGANVGSSISKKTDLLIYGADAGSKLAKATSLGVATMTEIEMVALLLAAPNVSPLLGGAADKIAEKQAATDKMMAPVRKSIATVNDPILAKLRSTSAHRLLCYIRVFSQRSDVVILRNQLGQPVGNSQLKNNLWGVIPDHVLALAAELGPMEWTWVFKSDHAEVGDSAEGYKGGRINLVGFKNFRWWDKPKDWDFCTFKAQSMFDELQNEGSTMLSFDPDEGQMDAILTFDDANDVERFPMGTVEEYFTQGAKRGFVWYWQRPEYHEARDFTGRLFANSLPRDTPPATIASLLVAKGLSEPEAQSMIDWLGEEVVILLEK